MKGSVSNGVYEIIPTVVPQKAEDIPAAIARYPFAHTLHVDIADGTLAPNTTWLPVVKEDFPTGVSYEVHLMVRDPLSLGITCARAGVQRLIAHVESFPHIERAREVFALWRAAGVKDIGCAINLRTPLSMCDSYAPLVDSMQIMTIAEIGEQGQPFDERAIARIVELHEHHPEILLAADGGVTLDLVPELARAGIVRFCVGSTLARAKDPASTYEELLKAANAVS